MGQELDITQFTTNELDDGKKPQTLRLKKKQQPQPKYTKLKPRQ